MKSRFETQKAYIVFSDQADLKYLKLLKRGYRHCFALLQDGDYWIAIDPLSCFTEIFVVPSDIDAPSWYQSQGMTVVQAPLDRSVRMPQIPGLFTCVEAIKRILGLRLPFVLTPWQLYRRLMAINYSKN